MVRARKKSQLPFGWVCFSNAEQGQATGGGESRLSQLPFGWVCFSNARAMGASPAEARGEVSIAFRLGLFL